MQTYFCINNEYTVMFSNENIWFSASYSPFPESSKKEFRLCCSDSRLHSAWNKKKNWIKLEYISYTMTLDCKKNFNATKWQIFEKKLKFHSKIWWFLAWQNYIFHPIIKLWGHCMKKQIHNKLIKDLLSSYSCSKFENVVLRKTRLQIKVLISLLSIFKYHT